MTVYLNQARKALAAGVAAGLAAVGEAVATNGFSHVDWRVVAAAVVVAGFAVFKTPNAPAAGE